MPRTSTLGEIEKEIERLSSKDQLKLVEKLVQQLRKSRIGGKKELDWKGLYGLGKGLWQDEDAQDYVNRLREDRVWLFRKSFPSSAAFSLTPLPLSTT